MAFLKKPRTLHWTHHSRGKMFHYRLSEARVRRILHSPHRIEEGIAPETIAYMQRAGSPKHPYELWVMVQDHKAERRVISAWRYPGVTKENRPLPKEVKLSLERLAEEAVGAID